MAGSRQQRGINQRRDPLRQSNRSGGHHLTHPDPLEAGRWWMADGGWWVHIHNPTIDLVRHHLPLPLHPKVSHSGRVYQR